MNKVWSEEERAFIKTHVEKYTDKEGAEKLSEITNRKISIGAYRKKRQEMGLRKMCGRGISRLYPASLE